MRILLSVVLLTVSIPAFGQAPPPDFPVPELREFVPVLARAVQMLGNNDVEKAFETLVPDSSPAIRTPEEATRFKDQWMKLMNPVGNLRLNFEAWEVVAIHRVSSQAYYLYGVASGKRGPMHLDYRVYKYRGRWHMEGFTFSFNWNRDQPIHADAKKLEVPVRYPFDEQSIAAAKSDSKPTAVVFRAGNAASTQSTLN